MEEERLSTDVRWITARNPAGEERHAACRKITA